MRILVALLLILGTSRAAHADEPDRYYGPILATDAVAAGSIVGAVQLGNNQLAIVGTLTYVVGGPMIHALKGNGFGAAKSLGVRLALPLIGATLGMTVLYETLKEDCFECHLHLPDPRPGEIGLAVGAALAVIVDYTFFAKRPARETRSLTPTASVGNGGLTLGLAGTF